MPHACVFPITLLLFYLSDGLKKLFRLRLNKWAFLLETDWFFFFDFFIESTLLEECPNREFTTYLNFKKIFYLNALNISSLSFHFNHYIYYNATRTRRQRWWYIVRS